MGGAQDDMFTAAGGGMTGEAKTLTVNDTLDGGAGNDTLVLDEQGDITAGLQTVKNIENLKVYQSKGNWDGDVSEFAGLKNVEVATKGTVTLTAGDSVTDVALTGATSTVSLTGNGITNVSAQHMSSVGLTVTNTTAKHTLNVTLDKVTNLTVNDATAETIGLTSNGLANSVFLDAAGAALKNIVIDGKGDLDLTASAATAATIDGSKAEGDLRLGTLNAATTTIKTGLGNDTFKTGDIKAKVTIDTGAGNDKVELAKAVVLAAESTISLGDGDDILTMDFANLTKNLVLDGGKNTVDGGDALIFNTAADFSKTTGKYAFFKADGAVKDFEVIGVNGVALKADAAKLGVTEFSAEGDNSALTLTNMAADSTVTFNAGNIGASTLNMADANSTLNLVLKNVGDTAFVSATSASIVTVGADEINVSSNHVADTTHTSSETTNVLFLNAQDNATVNLTGSQELHYTNNAAVVQKIDAHTFTGKLEITGNEKADTIIAGSGGSTITGGKGDDVITLGDGVDTIVISQAATGALNDVAVQNGKDTVKGFTAGANGDKINVGNFLSEQSGTASAATHFKGIQTGQTTVEDNTTYLVNYTGSTDLHDLTTTQILSEFFGSGKSFAGTAKAAGTEFGLMIEDSAGKAIFVMVDVDSANISGSTTIAVGDMAITLQLTAVTGDFTADNFMAS